MNTSTSPQVAYTYADGAANHARRTKITYPNGRILRYEYQVQCPAPGGLIPLSPWVSSTPQQDQQLIDLWTRLEQERRKGDRWNWSPLNNCWVPVLSSFDCGLPLPPLPMDPCADFIF